VRGVNDKLILCELIDSIITVYSSTKLSKVHTNLQKWQIINT